MLAPAPVSRGVARSAELLRVLALPRRSLADYDQAFAVELSRALRKPGSSFVLRPLQAAMLAEAATGRGLFGMVGVGQGKSTVAPLIPLVAPCARPLLLVPPAMKRDLETSVIPEMRKHFALPPLAIISYNELSTAKATDLLDRLQPDLIICDEAHALKRREAARTKRFARYFRERPDTRLIALSGTMARRSVRDFWHLILLTHPGSSCPMTRHWKEAESWALALDPDVHPSEALPAGALRLLCDGAETPREGLHRRLVDTEGVVAGSTEGVGASLVIRPLRLPVGPAIAGAVACAEMSWQLPDETDIVDPLDLHRRLRELSQGFYYRWHWPHGVDQEWLDARSAWAKAVQSVTRLGREGLDSELLVRNEAARGGEGLPSSRAADVLAAFAAWSRVADRDPPKTEARWLSKSIVCFALNWAQVELGAGRDALIWYESKAVLSELRDLCKDDRLIFCPATPKGAEHLLALSELRGKDPCVVVLSTAYAQGKNLQRWARNLVIAPPSSGAAWEQLLGRTHRPGQDADEVWCEVLAHTEPFREAIERAQEQALFLQQTTGSPQKLLQARWLKE